MIQNDLGIQRLTGHLVLVISEDLSAFPFFNRILKDRNNLILVYLFALRIYFIDKRALLMGKAWSGTDKDHHQQESKHRHRLPTVLHLRDFHCLKYFTSVHLTRKLTFVTIITSILSNTDLLQKWEEVKQLL